ncbi:ferredoxin--NADP reductase [Chondromyces crocatus]|uniref:ferredoxin--NADP reductase n=1 Tax=Chondromyces crocatus TaxID=52 RepID=UPI001470580D|nr:ferredoxin--NADP reductase [Chondromyces crocatus]
MIRETEEAVTLHLVDPEGSPFVFLPGQFLTLLVELEGETLRRAYSICSGLDEPTGGVAVTVKRVPNGRVSSLLVTQARPGDLLGVLGPSGNFTVSPDAARRRDLVLIGGGSGITPLFSMAQSVLAREPASTVRLLFANRSWDEIIFRAALESLEETYSGRFTVRHVLESAPEGWQGGLGRLDVEGCTAELEGLAGAIDETLEPPEFFVCGPEGLMAVVRDALRALRVPASRIHEERFASPGQLTSPASSSSPGQSAGSTTASAPQPLTLGGRGQGRTVVASAGQTLLEAGLGAGVAMPFSCAVGGCGACKVRLVLGSVEMEEPNCLSSEERARGFVLACASRATSAVTVEVP